MTCKLMSSARSVPAENSSSDLTFSSCSAQIPLVALGAISRSSCSEGDSNAAPFHRSLVLPGDARTPSRKRKPCPKKLCHLVQSVEAFIEHYYNRCGLHSAWGHDQQQRDQNGCSWVSSDRPDNSLGHLRGYCFLRETADELFAEKGSGAPLPAGMQISHHDMKHLPGASGIAFGNFHL